MAEFEKVEPAYAPVSGAPSKALPSAEPKRVSVAMAEVDEDLVQRYEPDQTSSCHPLSCALSIIFPCVWFSACYTVEEQTSVVELQWGKFVGYSSDAGVRCSNPCGRTVHKISNRQISKDLTNLKVIDSRGNPLLISGVVRYQWMESIRTALEVENPTFYVEAQATAVLKTVVSQFPYETFDGSACLRTEADEIGERLVTILQSRVKASGAKIISFQFNEISYAPEIAPVMLKRQQAAALVDARQTIVQGAVDVATEAVDELQELGHPLQQDEKARIVGNLLTLLCSDQDVSPMLQMNFD